MSRVQKAKFVASYDSKEARRELSSIWNMMKVDPLSPIGYYFRNMVLPGAGLGLEGLVTIHALFQFSVTIYPQLCLVLDRQHQATISSSRRYQ